MALLLDLALLSYRGLIRRPVISACLLLAVAFSCIGNALDRRNPCSCGAEHLTPTLRMTLGFRLGRAWPGIEQPEMVSTGRLSPLIEMLRRLGCSVSPVFIYERTMKTRSARPERLLRPFGSHGRRLGLRSDNGLGPSSG